MYIYINVDIQDRMRCKMMFLRVCRDIYLPLSVGQLSAGLPCSPDLVRSGRKDPTRICRSTVVARLLRSAMELRGDPLSKLRGSLLRRMVA
jgi:hypothetical protein